MRITVTPKDNEFVARIDEVPNLTGHGNTPEEARRNALALAKVQRTQTEENDPRILTEG